MEKNINTIQDKQEELPNEKSLDAGTTTFVPLVFSKNTHDKVPSISPREPLADLEDKALFKDMRRFSQSNISMHKLVLQLQKDVLISKPENILDFLADEWFAEKNHKKLKQMFY